MRLLMTVAAGAILLAGCAPFEHGHYAEDVNFVNDFGDPPGTPVLINSGPYDPYYEQAVAAKGPAYSAPIVQASYVEPVIHHAPAPVVHQAPVVHHAPAPVVHHAPPPIVHAPPPVIRHVEPARIVEARYVEPAPRYVAPPPAAASPNRIRAAADPEADLS